MLNTPHLFITSKYAQQTGLFDLYPSRNNIDPFGVTRSWLGYCLFSDTTHMSSPVTVPWHFASRSQVKMNTNNASLAQCHAQKVQWIKTFEECLISLGDMSVKATDICWTHRMSLCYWWRPQNTRMLRFSPPLSPPWTLLTYHVNNLQCSFWLRV